MKSEILARLPYVVLEGGEGCGKSTIAGKVAQFDDWMMIREPGGTEFGEDIREVLHKLRSEHVDGMASFLAYSAARANLFTNVIVPELLKGKKLISDRSWYSSLAYQGSAEVVPTDFIQVVSRAVTNGIEPRLVIYYDVAPEIGIGRRRNSIEWTRYDAKMLDFHVKVREAYKQMAKEMKDFWRVIDASKPLDEVFEDTLEVLEEFSLYSPNLK